MRPSAQPFWDNEFYLHENEKWFPYQRLSTYPRFETEAWWNSEMSYSIKTSKRSCTKVIWNNRLGNRLGHTKQGHGIWRFCNAGFEKCCLNRIKVEPYWDAHKFLCYAGRQLQMSIVLIAVYYFAAWNYPIRAKKNYPHMSHKSTKKGYFGLSYTIF